MADPAPIPIYEDRETFYIPYFEIKVRGNPMPRNVVRDVIDVSYEDSIEKVDAFTLTVNNWDADTRDFKYVGMETRPPAGSDAARFAAMFEPGTELQLWMGYRDNLRLMMTGFITTMEPDFPESGAPKLVVRGLNVLDRFRQKQFTWSWPEAGKETTRDSEIALDLARAPDDQGQRPGLGIEVRVDREAMDREPAIPYVLMNNQYPIVFLMERARRLGYTIFVGEEIHNGQPQRYLYFGPTQQLRNVTYQVAWGRSLVSFRPTLRTTNQVHEVTVCGWDRRTKKAIQETVKLEEAAPNLNPDLQAVARAAGRKEVVTDLPVQTPEEAKARARDILLNQIKEMVEGAGATVGLPDLRAGRMIEIAGCGYRFNGRYFVTETLHTINESGYRTTFKARREDPKGKTA